MDHLHSGLHSSYYQIMPSQVQKRSGQTQGTKIHPDILPQLEAQEVAAKFALALKTHSFE